MSAIVDAQGLKAVEMKAGHRANGKITASTQQYKSRANSKNNDTAS